MEAPASKKAKAAPSKGKKGKADVEAPDVPKPKGRKKAAKVEDETTDEHTEQQPKTRGSTTASRGQSEDGKKRAIKREDIDGDVTLPSQPTRKHRAARKAAPSKFKVEESETDEQADEMINGANEDVSDAAHVFSESDEVVSKSEKGRKRASRGAQGGSNAQKSRTVGLEHHPKNYESKLTILERV